jgi:phosphoglucosamine mutase
MARKYFGTDGIRGRANGVITPELALKVGPGGRPHLPDGRAPPPRADRQGHAPVRLHDRERAHRGFTSVGMDVLLTGPIPTPGVRC